MPAAVGSAVVLIIAVALALYFSRPVFLVFVGMLVLLASWEIAGAMARKQVTVTLIPIYLAAIAILAAAAMGQVLWVLVAVYVAVLAIVVTRMAWSTLPGAPITDIMASVFTLIYVPVFGSFVALISARDDSPWPLVFFIVVVVCNDLGGWLAGIMFGKHPMAPKLSPKKSWEGFAGSVILCGVAGYLATLTLDIQWWWAVPMALTGSVIGTLGDLTESLIKRHVGLKDMSGIMPGHGGIMDRLDSLLLCAPAFYLIYSLALGW